jgi:hypothetical protein
MKFKALIFNALLFESFFIQAQSDFRSGYIIKAEGDTIAGLINYRGDLSMAEECQN